MEHLPRGHQNQNRRDAGAWHDGVISVFCAVYFTLCFRQQFWGKLAAAKDDCGLISSDEADVLVTPADAVAFFAAAPAPAPAPVPVPASVEDDDDLDEMD